MVRRLLDVNVLLAILWENHEFHDRALRWLVGVPRLATCPISQLGFVRISSNPDLGYGFTVEGAFELLRAFLADPRHDFIADDLSCDARAILSEDIRSFKKITDHYLVALARQHHLTLATFDAPLSREFAHEPGLVELIR